MGLRVAEQLVLSEEGEALCLRVDLHGVSCFGPGDERILLRWEWIESIAVEDDLVVVVSGGDREVVFPTGAFGCSADALAGKLVEARSIFARGDVIEELEAAVAGEDPPE